MPGRAEVSADRQQNRKAYHHGDLKNALLQAGKEVLSLEGVNRFDLRKVARRAGVSHAAPYRHFADKEALIDAIVKLGFEELADRLTAKVEKSGHSTPEKLRLVALEYVGFAGQNPWLLREMFSGRGSQNRNSEIHVASKAVYRIYRDVIRTGQEAGEIRSGDPNALAGVLWSLMHGLAMLIIDDQVTPYAEGKRGIERFVSYSIRTLIDGMTE